MSAVTTDEIWPLKVLLDTLRSLSSRTSPTEPWGATATAEARAAIGSFFLASGTMSILQVELTWRDTFSAILEVYKQTRSPEASMLAQNFVGLILWRISVRWDKTSWQENSHRLRRLVAEMTGEEAISWLSRNNLRISAPFGPSVMWPLISEWFAVFEDAANHAFTYTPEHLLSEREFSFNVGDLAASLAHKRFELIYDFPFVQEGIRLVSIASGWIAPFVIMYRCTTNRVFTPLTRILFTIALVDQYFRGLHAPQPFQIKDRFAEDVGALGSKELIPALEANSTKRTSYEVRASAAIAYESPFVHTIQPGMAADKLRNGSDIIMSDTSLTEDSLAIHLSAVLRLISDIGLEEDNGAIDAAKAKLSNSARRAWDAIQYSSSPKQLLEALIERGFVRQVCRAYESALKTYFTRNYGSVDEGDIFDDVQQVVGCVAVIGNVVFGLIESYGPGMTYLSNYMENCVISESDSHFIEALGLERAIISQIIGRCIPPIPHEDYIKAARAVLVAEMDHVASKSEAVGFRQSIRSAKESLMLWFDNRANEIWGIVPPDESNVLNLDANLPNSDYSNVDSNVEQDEFDGERESEMIRLASTIRYPEPMPITPESTTPHFLKYIIATVCLDALTSVTTAIFSTPRLGTALKVLTWARDYGMPYLDSFINHRGKLNALISAIIPFTQDISNAPTTDDALNIEMLLGELYDVISVAISMLPQEARPFLPPRPDPSNSNVLISMHGTALHLQLNYLAERTFDCVEHLSNKSKQLVVFASIFKDFFTCKFVSGISGGTVKLYHHSELHSSLGTWKIFDVMTAIRELYDSANNIIADIRLDSMKLRTIIEETGKQLLLCDDIMEQANALGQDAVKLFSVLGADFAGLTRLQNSLDLHIRKLTSCNTPPGMQDICWLLGRWSILSEINSTYRDRSSHELVSAIENVGGVLQDMMDHDLASIGTDDKSVAGEIEFAVESVMRDYPVITEDDTTLVVTLSSRHNLTHRDEINFCTLDIETIAPDDVDLTSFARDFITKQRVTADALVNIIDTVFNTGRRANGDNA
ncbi:UL37 [Gallid alphaherpesvirus 2]|uniref:Inner tegument protein n=2 Tax=Gallid alphaherpesvirus 2 TaxID=10390 RepID=ITP_GAHVM|nr:tegument protein UL37 [Gallid alphaherpesvirus 2]Q9E6N2.1 RecName: Full=Inner tegument protein [Marek's disease herpesvirus type 1 strain MD5]AAG14230.1 UL37 tegument protein-like protein [Gallid alphaherpesvirus 2]ACF94875.1 UL37 [Gallid alphaherpesvirus 2]ALX80984.1 UL37 [Gallid alphaherpesvirus 2]ALX81102.1 UL37 [Gallid alphaherpesvirus 2]AQN77652.1 UL37 [Gallid alphaherpesvirus 2]